MLPVRLRNVADKKHGACDLNGHVVRLSHLIPTFLQT